MTHDDAAPTPDRFCAVVAVRDAHHRDLATDLADGLAMAAGVRGSVVVVAPRDRPGSIDDVAAGLVGRDGVLVVTDAHGGGPAAGPLFDVTVERLLTRAHQPVLVIGPGVPTTGAGAVPPCWHLWVPVEASRDGAALVAAARRWWASFGPTRVTVVGLEPPDPWPEDQSDPAVDPARAASADLRRHGLEVDLVRRRSVDPSTTLLAAALPAGAVLVVPNVGSPGADGRWFSALRRLVRGAACPVLAIPGR